ncbi:Predicted oxidoreductase [Verrucomicrobium sp. GAS474]|uniref:aldo/keto reductase n=1 Tax=Verrucomicrobium sp. GAS474 TaxID=1882831 RepID=UPI00087C1BCE|nr:aldo/keto reductase [Verrucomicrobium sp. GAS474]SDT91692.1 Predicted oxidoreductase [Verrucomicrobium sp. GAS474]
MNTLRLGTSGLVVSRLALGCMTYGLPERGNHPWTLPEEESRPFIKRALDLGINFFDTANAYSDGTSEEIVGRALRDYAQRDEIVVATKAYHPWRDRPNTGGLSRKALFAAVDDSLRRLGTDYIDLYQIHRWDPHTPIEETMEALHDIVKSGRVRYLGASSMRAWQFAKALHVAEWRGWTRFISMQPHYNLIYREEEREMFGLCRDEGIGVIPWSPLARGKLARPAPEPARPGAESPATARDGSDLVSRRLYDKTAEADRAVVEAVGRIAAARGLPPAQVALAWVLRNPVVTAPIIGASKPRHLEDAVAALELVLTPEEAAALEAPYVAHDAVI